MEKYQGKYRIPSARLAGYDYSRAGAYFVTICTAKRQHFFGDIALRPNPADQTMDLSPVGDLAHHFWQEIPRHFPQVVLGPFVAMPNHVHGILIITSDGAGENPSGNPHANPAWKPGTIGVIVNQYKRIVTIQARKILPDFAWQTRFHDHIIRNQGEYDRIATYIQNNPANWKSDKFYGTSI